ncbi:MAG: DMT family transporter [Sporolactobacillus sp.]
MVSSRKFFAYSSAILFVTIIGFSLMFVKIAIRFADPLDVLADRFTVAFIFSLIVLLVTRIKLSIHWETILHLLPLALLNPFLYFLAQALGLVYLPASEAGIIQATIPIFTLLFATLFLNEKTNWLQKLSIGLSVFGILFIFAMTGIQFGYISWSGISLMLVSTLSHSGYNVLARTTAKSYRMIDMTYLMVFMGFLSFNLIALTDHLMRGSMGQLYQPFLQTPFLLSVLVLGIFASFIAFFLVNFALSEVEASRFGAFTNLTTIIAVFSGAVFLHETLVYYHYIGAVLVILGVIGVNIFSAAKNPVKLKHKRFLNEK